MIIRARESFHRRTSLWSFLISIHCRLCIISFKTTTTHSFLLLFGSFCRWRVQLYTVWNIGGNSIINKHKHVPSYNIDMLEFLNRNIESKKLYYDKLELNNHKLANLQHSSCYDTVRCWTKVVQTFDWFLLQLGSSNLS